MDSPSDPRFAQLAAPLCESAGSDRQTPTEGTAAEKKVEISERMRTCWRRVEFATWVIVGLTAANMVAAVALLVISLRN